MERGHWYDACAAFSWTCWYGNQCYIVLCLVLLGLMVIFDNFWVSTVLGLSQGSTWLLHTCLCFETSRTFMDSVIKISGLPLCNISPLHNSWIQINKSTQREFRKQFWSINFFFPGLTHLYLLSWGYLSWNLFCWWLLQTPPYPLQKRFFVPYLEFRISRMPVEVSKKLLIERPEQRALVFFF